ncbi:MAG: hypothetical protein DGJ47_000763 [Rickettsiaceae bacterium]
MTATILVVDDLEQNIKLLEAKLLSEYYTVLTASSGSKALEVLKNNKIDIVLLDVMMPGMDGFETCQAIKSDPETNHIPVVMVTALTDVEDRVKGLESGADEFLTKPINDTALFARVASLTRMKTVVDELKLRNKINAEFGEELVSIEDNFSNCKILLLDDDIAQAKNIKSQLISLTDKITRHNNVEELLTSESSPPDLVIISCQTEEDPLRIAMMLRSNSKYSNIVIMLLAQEEDMPIVIKGMELGVNDYFLYPVEQSELQARAKTQLRKKIYQDNLRKELEEKVDLSTKDGLTGLFNRRYFDVHIKQMTEKVITSSKKLSLILLDLDNFKEVNDNYGHQSGDQVIKSFSKILKDSCRITDLIARYGGEEFIILVGNADINTSDKIAQKILIKTQEFEFEIPDHNQPLKKTTSIGIAEFKPGESVESFIGRADKALYKAKESGKNQAVKAT